MPERGIRTNSHNTEPMAQQPTQELAAASHQLSRLALSATTRVHTLLHLTASAAASRRNTGSEYGSGTHTRATSAAASPLAPRAVERMLQAGEQPEEVAAGEQAEQPAAPEATAATGGSTPPVKAAEAVASGRGVVREEGSPAINGGSGEAHAAGGEQQLEELRRQLEVGVWQ